ncbi:MAG: hypothetical protein ABL894_08975, partial [Hyphomicrobium sp.]
MADLTFTYLPGLPSNVFGHHLWTQYNIGASDMLLSMQQTGVINFRDFNFDGAPLSGSVSVAGETFTAAHLSNHFGLRNLESRIITPLELDWQGKVNELISTGLNESAAQFEADKLFAPQIRGVASTLFTSVNPLVNSSGQFIDFSGNVLTAQQVRAGGWYTPLTNQDAWLTQNFPGMSANEFMQGVDTTQFANRIDYKLGSAGISFTRDGFIPGIVDPDIRTSTMLNAYGSAEQLLNSGVPASQISAEIRAYATSGTNVGISSGVDWSAFKSFKVVAGVGLAVLGTAGDALALGSTVASSAASASAGDNLGAARTWVTYLANLAGGAIGAIGGGFFGSGIPVAGTFGGAVAGGAAGGELADRLAGGAFDYFFNQPQSWFSDRIIVPNAPSADSLSLGLVDGGLAWFDSTGHVWQKITANGQGQAELEVYNGDGSVFASLVQRADGSVGTAFFDASGNEIASMNENGVANTFSLKIPDSATGAVSTIVHTIDPATGALTLVQRMSAIPGLNGANLTHTWDSFDTNGTVSG